MPVIYKQIWLFATWFSACVIPFVGWAIDYWGSRQVRSTITVKLVQLVNCQKKKNGIR